jgi:hypothetical protein
MVLQHVREGLLRGGVMDNEERISILSAYLECPMEAAALLNAKMTLKKFKN